MKRIEELMIMWQDNAMGAAEFVELKECLQDLKVREFFVESLLTDAVIREVFQSHPLDQEDSLVIETTAASSLREKGGLKKIKWLLFGLGIIIALSSLFWLSKNWSDLTVDHSDQVTDPVVEVTNSIELRAALASARSEQMIILAPGIYELGRQKISDLQSFTITGSSKTPADTVIRGSSKESHSSSAFLSFSNCQQVTLSYLKFQNGEAKGVELHSACRDFKIESCHFQNLQEEMIYTYSPSENVLIQNCEFYNTRAFSRRKSISAHAIFCRAGESWIVRNNNFRNISFASDSRLAWEARGAVFFWGPCSDILVEKNTFLNCHRSIMFGVSPSDGKTEGIISNNFIAYHVGYFDRERKNSGGVTPRSSAEAPVLIWNRGKVDVFHNTIVTNGEFPGSIEVRWSRDVTVTGNLADSSILYRNGGRTKAQQNLFQLKTDWFEGFDPHFSYQSNDPVPEVNLHLKPNATMAFDQVDSLLNDDIDGDPRPSEGKSAVGADERVR